jgi:hypothetical protein
MAVEDELPLLPKVRREVRIEYGLRTVRDDLFHRKGHVEERSTLEYALATRERPFSGWKGDEQIVTRTVVIYTTQWAEVPDTQGSRHLSCGHNGTPQGRTGPPIMPGSNICMEGPGYQLPHNFRERDMTYGEDGIRRYTCPVCGNVLAHRGDMEAAQRPLF